MDFGEKIYSVLVVLVVLAAIVWFSIQYGRAWGRQESAATVHLVFIDQSYLSNQDEVVCLTEQDYVTLISRADVVSVEE